MAGLSRRERLQLSAAGAVKAGYEALIRAAGAVTAAEIDRLKDRLAPAGDPRDILAARDSITERLGVPRPGS